MNDPLLWSFMLDSLRSGTPCTLLLTVRTEGSGPGRPGAAMAVTTERTYGTVGGGTLELSLIRRAMDAMEAGITDPVLVEHHHSDHRSREGSTPSGMICSGSQTTAVLPLHAGLQTSLETVGSILMNGTSGTLVLSDSGLEVSDNATHPTGFQRVSNRQWRFTARLGTDDTVYIVGGGHVGRALAELLARLPFRPVIIDSRSPSEPIEGCEWRTAEFGEAHTLIAPGHHSWAVVMTPDHTADLQVLKNLSSMELRYVGLMASSAKKRSIYAGLREAGAAEDWLEGISCPIGLPIGGRSPWVIAVSVAAELISLSATH